MLYKRYIVLCNFSNMILCMCVCMCMYVYVYVYVYVYLYVCMYAYVSEEFTFKYEEKCHYPKKTAMYKNIFLIKNASSE